MIIVKLTGGLANQMFQYAAGLAMAEKKHATLKLDLTAYDHNKKRVFGLEHFNISVEKASVFEILCHKYLLSSTYLVGDFQSPVYFTDSTDLVRTQFTLQEPIENIHPELTAHIKSSNSVAVHIRRTDYIDKQHRYRVLTPEYYTHAMKIVGEKISEPKYFFFSDDIEWVKENIIYPTDSVFLSHADYEDIALMSLCKHTIIANSTFSWWAAWLNTNPDKIITSPAKWFTDTYSQDTNLLPKEWILL